MTSLDDVARAAGVSAATVSRALSGRGNVSTSTRAKIQKVAAELDYVASSAASSLASGRMRNLGVIMPELHRWFFNTVLTGISDEATSAGYDVTLYNVTGDPEVRREIFSAFLRRRRVDAVVVVALELSDWEEQELTRLEIPVVIIGGTPGVLPGVAIDDLAITELATAHLLELGHEVLGFLGGAERFDADYKVPSQRREGFDRALRRRGLQTHPALIGEADFTIPGGFHAARQLLGMPGTGMTGLVAASDEMAIGAILAARELGMRVPEDLSVVGIDGHELGGLFELTTVDQHAQHQGATAAKLILATVEAGGAQPEKLDLSFDLLVRRSTARLAPTADQPTAVWRPSGPAS
ncbi:LacI family DNA-binding transcriptional regulator [Nesterenkonia sandarakina]|uniref:LacI family transcriptional regulator n=1 Tax=Nesterenkonia sandarakina TaxID=272918 RepID=A0A2T0YSG3_9MICC|nr:LacI family DNA-binding transcriptional regulator [Nesterenkonia sandarakina]PRZ18724.1 LacI family transcriptional regulator [Nesterenkonia sandarakina]